jgi:hypothetical protein
MKKIDTGSDRLGITAIYLSLIDMHVVVTMLRIGRGSFRVDSKSRIEPFCGDMQKPPNSDQSRVIHDRERANVLISHQLDRLKNRCIWRD